MPHWLAWVAIVAAAWLVLAVVGGLLVGRGLRAIERRSDEVEAVHRGSEPPGLRHAA
jgi:hypothetical protein